MLIYSPQIKTRKIRFYNLKIIGQYICIARLLPFFIFEKLKNTLFKRIEFFMVLVEYHFFFHDRP